MPNNGRRVGYASRSRKAKQTKADAGFKAQQEKERREAAIANVTSIRILEAITAAVPVRLMKCDLVFVVERLAFILDENRLAILRAATRQVLLDAATAYKVDADAIALKVKQEFAAREKGKSEEKTAPKPPVKQQAKAARKSAAA